MSHSQVTTVRLDRETLSKLDEMAHRLHVDRATLLRRAVTIGSREVVVEEAVLRYARGEVSAGAAAELGGISYWDFLAELQRRGIPYRTDMQGLLAELEAIDGAGNR